MTKPPTSQPPIYQSTNLPVIMALLLAIALRLFLLSAQSLRGDEAYGVLAAGQGWAGLANVLSTSDPHPPLYYVLLMLWMPLAGYTEFALRFLSVLPSVLMVPVVYVLGRELFDERIALVGAFLAAINPFYIWQAQDARMYPLLGFLAATSALLMLVAWRKGGWWRWIAYVIVTTLALYTHYFAALTVLVENLLAFGSLVLAAHRAVVAQPSVGRLIRTVVRDPRTGRWGLSQIAVLLLYLPWLVAAAGLFSTFGGYVPAAGVPTLLVEALIGFSLGPTLDLYAAFLLTIGYGMLLAIGLIQRRASTPHPHPPGGETVEVWGDGRLAAATYLFVPVVLVALLSQWRPMFQERYLIGITPFYLLLLALGLVAASESFIRPGDRAQTPTSRAVVRRTRLTIGLAYIVAASAFALGNHYFNPTYAKSPDWRGMTAYLHAHERPGDLIIENAPEPTFTYYYGLVQGGRNESVLLPRTSPADASATVTEIDELTRQHRRLWLIPQAGSFWDPDGLVQSWLDANTGQAEAHDFDGVGLDLYLSSRAVPGTPSYPLDVRFGNSIALTGYDLVEREAGSGERGANYQSTNSQSTNLPNYQVTLYWRCLAPVQTDYTIFVHLVRADGSPGIFGQQDSPPLRGTYPTSRWQPGQALADDFELTVRADAPAGAYTLAVGFYDPTSGARLPATDAAGLPLGDHARFGTIEVQPR